MEKSNDSISRVLLTIDKYKGKLSHLKAAVVEDEYNSKQCPFFSRTLVWKAVLVTDSLKIQSWNASLERTRSLYDELYHIPEMSVPWSKLSDDSVYYQKQAHVQSLSRSPSPSVPSSLPRSGTINRSRKTALARVSASDPLTPLQPTPHSFTETDVDLLDSIILDIDRLFPGEDFYKPSNANSLVIRRQLIEVLYIWCKCHPTVGYKQGIHEIVGLVYMNLYQESIIIRRDSAWTNEDLMILNMYDMQFLSHDLFTLMNQFLVQSGIISSFYESEAVLWKSIEKFNSNLMKIDQLIHYNLVSQLKIESQLWIIRYLRLLLLREVASGGNHGKVHDLEVVSLYWDKLICNPFGLSTIPDLIMFSVIQLLIQLKTDLITCDFGEALSLLLHYPIQAKVNSRPHAFVASLIKDASMLYEVRSNDLKLYEVGLKLNQLYNPHIKINYTSSKSSSTPPSKPISNTDSSSRAQKMKFEKLRLEMRLKKKTQQILNQ